MLSTMLLNYFIYFIEPANLLRVDGHGILHFLISLLVLIILLLLLIIVGIISGLIIIR